VKKIAHLVSISSIPFIRKAVFEGVLSLETTGRMKKSGYAAIQSKVLLILSLCKNVAQIMGEI
jgi:hypothetical protein